MSNDFEEFLFELTNSLLSNDVMNKIIRVLDEQTNESIGLFVTRTFQSLLKLEQWTWQTLSQDYRKWIDDKIYSNLFHSVNLLNIKIIRSGDSIPLKSKESLLIPSNIEWIDGVLNQIATGHDTFLLITSLYFETISYLIQDQSESAYLPNAIHLNNRLGRDFVMTNQYQIYLRTLHEKDISKINFTKTLLFYLKTCSFSLNVYFSSKSQNFPFTGNEILKYIGEDYTKLILLHSNSVDLWTNELLSCISHLTGLVCSTCWWGGKKFEHIELLIPSSDKTHSLLHAFICILNHQSIYRSLSLSWQNDDNLLIGAILVLLLGIVETQNLGCYINSQTDLTKIALKIAQTSSNNYLVLYAYGFLASTLSNDQIKELKIADNICSFLFNTLEQAWKHPTKKWKKVPVQQFLKGLLSLSTNDTIQMTVAQLKKLSLLIEMCETYPMVYEIIWSLSFNRTIQDQLRLNSSFLTHLTKLQRESNDLNIRKSVNGILWALNPQSNDDQPINNTNHSNSQFDIMISYSHKDKEMCKKIYDELVRIGYRIWIDFDQMHGNVMDAMAQAIEHSNAIIICMSEHYQKSNFCRAEAQYGFKRNVKLIPILLQEHYRPNGWLSFLIGQLLYVDFIKHEFSVALQMLTTELKSKQSQDTISNIPSINSNSSIELPLNIRDWTQSHVQIWLRENNLPQFARILSDIDGPGLINFAEFMTNGESKQVLSSLQQDSYRRTNEAISLVEIARFQSLIKNHQGFITNKSNDHSKCCLIM